MNHDHNFTVYSIRFDHDKTVTVRFECTQCGFAKEMEVPREKIVENEPRYVFDPEWLAEQLKP